MESVNLFNVMARTKTVSILAQMYGM